MAFRTVLNQAFRRFRRFPRFSLSRVLSGISEFMSARYKLNAVACEVQETPWAQLSQCDTGEQPIHMAWFTRFRFDWRNFTIGFGPIEGIPREEPPRVAEPAHVDQRAPLCFGGCGRLSTHPRGPVDPPLRQRPRATVRHHESAALRPRPSVRLQPHHAGPGGHKRHMVERGPESRCVCRAARLAARRR